jgi:hypothetical protein
MLGSSIVAVSFTLRFRREYEFASDRSLQHTRSLASKLTMVPHDIVYDMTPLRARVAENAFSGLAALRD